MITIKMLSKRLHYQSVISCQHQVNLSQCRIINACITLGTFGILTFGIHEQYQVLLGLLEDIYLHISVQSEEYLILHVFTYTYFEQPEEHLDIARVYSSNYAECALYKIHQPATYTKNMIALSIAHTKNWRTKKVKYSICHQQSGTLNEFYTVKHKCLELTEFWRYLRLRQRTLKYVR